jgi:hypothetical protein
MEDSAMSKSKKQQRTEAREDAKKHSVWKVRQNLLEMAAEGGTIWMLDERLSQTALRNALKK